MDIQSLIDRQHEENLLVLRAFENVSKTGPITKGKLDSRMKLLEDRWNGIVARHLQILELRKKDRNQDDPPYFADNLYATYEDFYANERAKFIDAAVALDKKEKEEAAAASNTFGGGAQTTQQSSFRVPTIDIPKFSGKYSDWNSFKDLFQAVVGKNPNLTDGQRLAHLKSSLVGEAAACIKNISVSDGNYGRACTRLIEHFENKRSLVHIALRDLTHIQPMAAESASLLRALRDSTVDVIETLEALERPVQHWDDMLVYLTVQRVDEVTRRDWETSLGECKEPATFKELDKFLQTRIRALELAKAPEPELENSQKPSGQSKGQGNVPSKGK